MDSSDSEDETEDNAAPSMSKRRLSSLISAPKMRRPSIDNREKLKEVAIDDATKEEEVNKILSHK